MKSQNLNPDEKSFLLKMARETMENAVRGMASVDLPFDQLSPLLRKKGASFVTLTKDGGLRGCIGSLEAHQSLAEDVRDHAVQAALEDYRFRPVVEEELGSIEIEISRLTSPVQLKYDKVADLPELLQPGVDGVILKDGFHRATFLPQVWDQLPDPRDFLNHLCQKMGGPAALWESKVLDVSIYQVEEFSESSKE